MPKLAENQTDAAVIRNVLGGESSQFEILVERYLPLVRALCKSHIFEEDARQDLIQDSFIECYCKLGNLRNPSKFAPWLTTIARNKCLQWIRRRKREQRVVEQLERIPKLMVEPLHEIAQRELADWLDTLIQKLPRKTREAMCLYYLEGVPMRDAAAALGIGTSALKQRLFYGRKVLGEEVLAEVRRNRALKPHSATDESVSHVMAAIPLAGTPATASPVISGIALKTAIVFVLCASAATVAAVAYTHLAKETTAATTLGAETGNVRIEIAGPADSEYESVRICYAVLRIDYGIVAEFLDQNGIAPKHAVGIAEQMFAFAGWQTSEVADAELAAAMQSFERVIARVGAKETTELFSAMVMDPGPAAWKFADFDKRGHLQLQKLEPGFYLFQVLTWPASPPISPLSPWRTSNQFIVRIAPGTHSTYRLTAPDDV